VGTSVGEDDARGRRLLMPAKAVLLYARIPLARRTFLHSINNCHPEVTPERKKKNLPLTVKANFARHDKTQTQNPNPEADHVRDSASRFPAAVGACPALRSSRGHRGNLRKFPPGFVILSRSEPPLAPPPLAASSPPPWSSSQTRPAIFPPLSLSHYSFSSAIPPRLSSPGFTVPRVLGSSSPPARPTFQSPQPSAALASVLRQLPVRLHETAAILPVKPDCLSLERVPFPVRLWVASSPQRPAGPACRSAINCPILLPLTFLLILQLNTHQAQADTSKVGRLRRPLSWSSSAAR